MLHPRVLQLIMDSLRYWVLDMHVDGFRFDLASTLARELFEVDQLGAFFDIIHQDPVLSQVKLIAEPWDVGEGGYQVGNFPVLWTEWNGKYRDCVRRFWKGDGGTVAEFATRLAGCSDLYAAERPAAVRQHQLRHLPRRLHAARSGQLQRQAQRGQRRGQQGRRQRQQQLELRRRRADRRPEILRPARAAEAQLDGHAVLVAGRADAAGGRRVEPHAEGQQQRLLPGQRADLAELGAGRGATGVPGVRPARRRGSGGNSRSSSGGKFFQGRSIRGSEIKDLSWFDPAGQEMSDEDWNAGFVKCLGVRLAGDLIGDLDERGEPIVGETLLLLLNAHHEPLPFTLPKTRANHAWERLLDTADGDVNPIVLHGGQQYPLQGRSLALLRVRPEEEK